MPKNKETNPLRKWMKENGVWQLDLCNMLEVEDIETLDEFQSLPKSTVLELIDRAKKTGFMHASKLKALHGGFPKKKKKKKAAPKNNNNAPKPKDYEVLKREARPELEAFMRDNGIWQIDLFDLMTDTYQIYSVQEFKEIKQDEDLVDEFLEEAKFVGVMGKQATTLAVFCGKKKKKKKAKKKEAPKQNKPRQKDHEEMKIEARPVLEQFLRDNNVWQIDLFDMMVDKYQIYCVEDFMEYKEDEDWIDEFLEEAKHVGVMGQKVKHLQKMVGRKKNVNKKKKKQASAPKQSKPRQKDHEEMKIEARPVLEKFLRDNNVWQIDLFDMMVDKYQIYCVDDFMDYKEDEDWIDEFIEEAKHVGVMGQKVKHLEKMVGRKKNVNKKKKKQVRKVSAPKEKKLSPEEITMKARDEMEPFMDDEGFWHKDLFLILLQYEVYEPSDMGQLSKSDRKEIIQKAKQKGLSGAKAKKFKAYFG